MAYADTRLRLLKALPSEGIAAEIGVWKGDYSAQILEYARPKTLHLIDPWALREDPAYDTAYYGAARAADMEAIHQGVLERFSTEIDTGQVIVHRAPSASAMANLPDGSLDFVYVDGDHAFGAVRQDLALSFMKVRSGGFICIDDHVIGKWWKDGIVRAVNDFLGTHAEALELKFCSDTQVVIAKR